VNDIEYLVGGIFNTVTFLSSLNALMTIKMIHSCIVYQRTSNYDGIRHTSADETDTASRRSVYMSCSYS
jgi:hypothetical protein